MEVMHKLLEGNAKRSRTFPDVESIPKTEDRMILAEFLWKSSNCTAATAPRTRDATAVILVSS